MAFKEGTDVGFISVPFYKVSKAAIFINIELRLFRKAFRRETFYREGFRENFFMAYYDDSSFYFVCTFWK